MDSALAVVPLAFQHKPFPYMILCLDFLSMIFVISFRAENVMQNVIIVVATMLLSLMVYKTFKPQFDKKMDAADISSGFDRVVEFVCILFMIVKSL